MNILLVGLGGFLGAIARYLLSLFIAPINNFPIATLFTNIIGCFLVGLFFGYKFSNNNEYMDENFEDDDDFKKSKNNLEDYDE